MSANENEIKRQICQLGRRMFERGYVAANDGNISYRLGEGRYLCTPTGVSKGDLEPEDIAVVDDEGRQLEGRRPRTSEILMHLVVYHELPRINAVCHAHPPHATAFAVAGVEPPTNVMPEVETLLGPVPLAQYETPGGRDFAQTILPHLRRKANTILLSNHGAVAFDTNLQEAYWHLETLDSYCRILLLAKQVGRIRRLPREKVQEILELKKRMNIDDPRHDPNIQPDILAGSDAFLRSVASQPVAEGGETAKLVAAIADEVVRRLKS